MSVVELARLRASNVYRTAFVVEAVFTCERKPSNCHSDRAIVVKKPKSGQVDGHVPDKLARVLSPLLASGKVLSMCEVTGLSMAAEEGK